MIVEAVGISCNTLNRNLKQLVSELELAMQQEVLKACEEGLRVNEDAALIKERMLAVRTKKMEEYFNG